MYMCGGCRSDLDQVQTQQFIDRKVEELYCGNCGASMMVVELADEGVYVYRTDIRE